jgi:hypothetical protein
MAAFPHVVVKLARQGCVTNTDLQMLICTLIRQRRQC